MHKIDAEKSVGLNYFFSLPFKMTSHPLIFYTRGIRIVIRDYLCFPFNERKNIYTTDLHTILTSHKYKIVLAVYKYSVLYKNFSIQKTIDENKK